MIYEDEEKFEKPSHVSYKEYKQKLESKPNESLIIFVSAFFVMLLIFLGTAKQLSPDVDVSIGDNSDTEYEEIARGNVDDRLRLIQMEDNSYDDTFNDELEEKVILPEHTHKTFEEKNTVEEPIVLEQPTNSEHKAENASSVTEQPASPAVTLQPAVVNAKVIVGYYATAEQAEVAKGIIQEAGLNIQPFIKNIGSAYTLQVGSFSSLEKAQSVANDLLKLPKIIDEQTLGTIVCHSYYQEYMFKFLITYDNFSTYSSARIYLLEDMDKIGELKTLKTLMNK